MSRWMAWAYDSVLRGAEEACLQAWRRELLAPLHGEVLEIGAGTGANLGLYPPPLERLVLTEPDPHMRRRLAHRLEGSDHDHAVLDATAESLPVDAGSFDWVVSTLVLCSVRDPMVALAEIRRVLRPGGALVFLEHVGAPHDSTRRWWQRCVEPVWRCAAGNCHLTRDTEASLQAAGLTIESIERESIRKTFPLVRPSIRGVARR